MRRGVAERASARRALFGVLAALAAVLTVVLGYPPASRALQERRIVAEYARVAATLPAELAAAKREGLALRPQDLPRTPPAPDAQNAARLYERAFRIIRASPPDDATEVALWFLLSKAALSPAERRHIDAFVRPYDAALRWAEAGSVLPACDFGVTRAPANGSKLSDDTCARQIARMLAMRASVEGDSGNPGSALRDVRTIARIAHHMGARPGSRAPLVETGLERIADGIWIRTVLHHQNDRDVLRAAAAASAELERLPDIPAALRAGLSPDREFIHEIRRDPAMLNDQWVRTLAALAGRKMDFSKLVARMRDARLRRVMTDAWEARVVAERREMVTISQRERADPAALYKSLTELEERMDARSRTPTYELSGMIVGPLGSDVPEGACILAELGRLRRTTLGIVGYHLERGTYPATLADLSRKAEPDLFTSNLPAYQRISGGFLLSSEGPTLTYRRLHLTVRWPPGPYAARNSFAASLRARARPHRTAKPQR